LTKLLQERDDGRVEFEDIGGSVADRSVIERSSGAVGQFFTEICFRAFTAFHEPLPLILEQELPNGLVGEAGCVREIATHQVVRKVHEHVAHVEEAGANRLVEN
jgi:hypothetical protein